MDCKALADSLTQILAPALPRLIGRGMEDFPRPTVVDLDMVGALWFRLRHKVEGKPAAAEAAQDVARDPKDPDAQAALRVQLRKLLEGDAVLAADMARILGAGAIVGSGGKPDAVAVGAGGIAMGNVIGGEIGFGSIRAKSRD